MNKVIAMQERPESGVMTGFFKKLFSLRATFRAILHVRAYYQENDNSARETILCSFQIPKVSFRKDYFLDFLAEACVCNSPEIRLEAVGALKKAGFVNADDSATLGNILELKKAGAIDLDRLFPSPKALKVFYQIRNKLDKYSLTRIQSDIERALLRIQKPNVEDFQYLLNYLKGSIEGYKKHWNVECRRETEHERGRDLFIERGNFVLAHFCEMNRDHMPEKCKKELILLLFEAVGILKEDLIKKIYLTLSPPKNDRMTMILQNFSYSNESLISEMAKFYLKSGSNLCR